MDAVEADCLDAVGRTIGQGVNHVARPHHPTDLLEEIGGTIPHGSVGVDAGHPTFWLWVTATCCALAGAGRGRSCGAQGGPELSEPLPDRCGRHELEVERGIEGPEHCPFGCGEADARSGTGAITTLRCARIQAEMAALLAGSSAPGLTSRSPSGPNRTALNVRRNVEDDMFPRKC